MATLPGARLYARYGYSGTERVHYEVQPGVTIEFIPMSKKRRTKSDLTTTVGRALARLLISGVAMIRSTMQRVPLSSNNLLERAGKIYPQSEVVSRMPDKSLHRYRFADFYRRSRQLASALLAAGLKKGDRVATLSWNHYAHLECYFGIPAAGGVMHTLNLRLAPDEIAWIANHAEDRFLDRRRRAAAAAREVHATRCRSRRSSSCRSPARRSPAPFVDYEDFLAERAGRLRVPAARRGRPDRDVLHVGHHRPAEGRRLLASLDGAAHAGRQPARPLGPARRTTACCRSRRCSTRTAGAFRTARR